MIDQYHRLAADLTCEDHDSRTGGQDALPRRAGQIESAMSGQPVVLGVVETAYDPGTWMQRPIEFAVRSRLRSRRVPGHERDQHHHQKRR